jgi:cytosine deaminase
MDVLIRRARLQLGQVVDVGIEDGVIVALEPGITASARLELDASERLTVPAFVNGHLHACKSFWRRPLGLLGFGSGVDFTDPNARFAAIAEVKRQYTIEDVLDRADETIKLALKNGTCAVRLFADVDSDAGLRALDGLLRVRDRYRDTLKVQVVAFPQNGVFRHRSSTESLLRQALEMNLDALGGIPWLEPTEEAQRAHVDLVLELAQARNLDAHFVLDDTEDPTSRTIEYVAARTIALGLQGRVHGTQANALSYYDDAHAARVIRLVRDAGMTIFSNAHVALVTSGGSGRQPAPRGMTRVRELLAAGVPVATAQDDIDNPYYAFGRNDLLEVAQYMAHLGPFAWGAELDRVLEMVTYTPARVMRLEGYGLESGARANILVLDAPSWRDAVQFQVAKSLVVVNGRLVAREERKQELYV